MINVIKVHTFISEFDGDNLVAQAAIFLVAGFETSATTMAFAMYELALQLDLQMRVRDEIDSVLVESDGKLTYEKVRMFY